MLNVYRVLTLTAQTYTESLLNDKALMMASLTSYIRSSLGWLSLHGDSFEKWKPSWWLWQPILFLIMMANSYHLHRTLILTTKRRCEDIKMNHLWGKLWKLSGHSGNYRLRVLTFTPSEYKKMLRLLGEGSRRKMGLRQWSGPSENCRLRVLTLTPLNYKKMFRLLGEGARQRMGLQQLSVRCDDCKLCVLTLTPSKFKKTLWLLEER